MHQNHPEQFQKDLQTGQYNELKVGLFFMLRGAWIKLQLRGNSYDLHVIPPKTYGFYEELPIIPYGCQELHIEIKWDKRFEETGNLYFEHKNTRQNKASGIAATHADYWCQVIGKKGNSAALMTTKFLREFLEKRAFEIKQTLGVDSNSQGTVVPKVELQNQKENVIWIELPTPEEFFEKIFRK